MKKKVFSLMAVVAFTVSSLNLNVYSQQQSVLKPDCNEIYNAVYEEAIFSGYSFGDALDMADAVGTICELFNTYLF